MHLADQLRGKMPYSRLQNGTQQTKACLQIGDYHFYSLCNKQGFFSQPLHLVGVKKPGYLGKYNLKCLLVGRHVRHSGAFTTALGKAFM